MIFVLHKNVRVTPMPEGPEPLGLMIPAVVERWTWDYRQGSEKNPGDVALAVCPTSYPSEREARSAIAKARKAFGGARMAKVIPSDD